MPVQKTLICNATFCNPVYTDDLAGDMVKLWNAFTDDTPHFAITAHNVRVWPSHTGDTHVAVVIELTCAEADVHQTHEAFQHLAYAVADCVLKDAFLTSVAIH